MTKKSHYGIISYYGISTRDYVEKILGFSDHGIFSYYGIMLQNSMIREKFHDADYGIST